MKEIQEEIEKVKFNLLSIGQELQGGVNGKRFSELHKEADNSILHLLSLVAEKQREVDAIEVNSTHGALCIPLITEQLNQKP